MKIELKDVQLYAFHGVYKEERRIGNDYILDLSVEISENTEITTIKDTVNYVTLYEIVKDEMSRPSDLLETVVSNIADTIHKRFPHVRVIDMGLYKMNALIPQFRGKVGVRYSKTF